MTRPTLYRDAPGGHFHDCVIREDGEAMLCHCQIAPAKPNPIVVPLAAYRADPLRYERMVTPERPLRVVDADGKVYSTSSVDAPEPCNFVAPPDLDGPPPCRQITVRAVVGFVSWLVAALLALSLLTSCAQSQTPAQPTYRPWAYSHATIIVPHEAPECAIWTVREAWEFLRPGPGVTVERGYPKSPAAGEIVVDWSKPEPPNLGIANLYGDQPTWQKSRYTTRAVVQADRCEVRLWAHELSHVRGLINVAEPNRLMTGQYPLGGWLLSNTERLVLSGKWL